MLNNNAIKVLYFAAPDQPHWQDRKLAHTGSFTSLLNEQLIFNGARPAIGERLYEYEQHANSSDPFPTGITHYREGAWLVTQIDYYQAEVQQDSNEKYQQIIFCYCEWHPLEKPGDWRKLRRVAPSDENIPA
jgi:hypothetical protein